jgi:hypothetical protein
MRHSGAGRGRGAQISAFLGFGSLTAALPAPLRSSAASIASQVAELRKENLYLKAVGGEDKKKIAELEAKIQEFSSVRMSVLSAFGVSDPVPGILPDASAVPIILEATGDEIPAGAVPETPPRRSVRPNDSDEPLDTGGEVEPRTPVNTAPVAIEKEPTPTRPSRAASAQAAAAIEAAAASESSSSDSEDGEEDGDVPLENSDRVVLCTRVSQASGPSHQILLNDIKTPVVRQFTRPSGGSTRKKARRLDYSNVFHLRILKKGESAKFENESGKNGRLPDRDTWKMTPEMDLTIVSLVEAWEGGMASSPIGHFIADKLNGSLAGFVKECNAAFRTGWETTLGYLDSIIDHLAEKMDPTIDQDTVIVQDDSDGDEYDFPGEKRAASSRAGEKSGKRSRRA